MRIEAVITCDNYADFLAATLPLNRHHFDHMVVVTDPSDRQTRRICEYWEVQCVATDVLRAGGASFAKGRGINAGLDALACDGWVVHMDADIFLPPLTRRMLEVSELDPGCVYGLDRMMCKSYRDWTGFLRMPALQHEADIFVHPQPFPIGTRIARSRDGGYIPIGFFQMWHPVGSGVPRYPEQHTTASRGDMLFALEWPRRLRRMIPEIIAMHLESEPCPMGANWSGRTTAPFGPEPLTPLGPAPQPREGATPATPERYDDAD